MENVEDIYRLTPVQDGMLYHALSSPGTGVYIEQFFCRIDGELEVERFKAAWAATFAKYPALRTLFLWEDVDEPLQVVREKVELIWRDDVGRRDLATLLQDDRNEDFELTAAPLCRMRLWHDGDLGWRFLWTFHHILLDGWSAPLVVRDMLAEYAGVRRPAGMSFANYVAWWQQQDPELGKAFWAPRLGGGLDRPKIKVHSLGESDVASCSARIEQQLEIGLVKSLKAMAKANMLTMNTVVHGAWALTAARYNGAKDFFIGSTVSGRPPELPDIETLVGCCLNTLPLRIEIRDERSLLDWLRELQAEHVAMREHEATSLASLQRVAGLRAGEALFDSIVVYENPPFGIDELADGGITFVETGIADQSNYPLAILAVPEGETIRVIMIHQTATHRAAAAEKLLACFLNTLRWFTASPKASLCERPNMGAEDVANVKRWSHSPMPPGADGTVLDRLANDDRPALIYDDAEISYSELGRQAGVIAGELIRRGAKLGERVGVRLERSPEMVYAIWGVLKAGCAYVPLDPSYPASRISMVLEDSGARFLLTRRGEQGFGKCESVEIDELKGAQTERLPAPEDLAYVIYTSGSTGRPKGIGVTHANLQYSTAAREAYYPEAVGRFLLLSSISFDSSVAGIFWTLTTGGTLVLPRDGEEQDVEALSGIIAETGGDAHALSAVTLRSDSPARACGFIADSAHGRRCRRKLHGRTL